MDTGRVNGTGLLKAGLAALCAIAVAGAAWAVGSLRVGAVTPADGARVNKKQLTLSAAYEGYPGGAVVSVDGSPLPTELHADRREISAAASGLSDGAHVVEVRARRPLGLGEVVRAWTVNVDTTPPRITVTSPARDGIVKERQLRVLGQTEPGTRLHLRVSNPRGHAFDLAPFTVEADGRFSALVTMGDDRNRIRIDAVDAANNRALVVWPVTCDLAAPTVSDVYPAPDAVIRLDPTVTVRARVAESGSGIARATLVVDGRAHALTLAPEGGEVRLTCDDLPEGTREVALEVEDRAGWKTRKAWSFLVDTIETFGSRAATRGARGKDVAGLQKRLIRRHDLADDHVTSVFDEATESALQQFQARSGVNVDGILGADTIARLSPRIEVDLSRFTLTLLDDDVKVKSYDIACGMPEFPTPKGRFHVAYLERNPTWIPPKDSVWAREAKVTPPGPGNPLGTRWIGLDSNAVGIHGTNAEWTVGSRASHGCIRMRIRDVEDLFERVNPGTRVRIF